MSTELDLVSGKFASWNEWSYHANERAGKAWAMCVTGTDPKYGVDGEWLPKQRIDGNYHFDVSGLAAGDIVKVSGASHKNKQHSYWRVEENGETLKCESMSEADAIEYVDDSGAGDLRRELIGRIREADEETLEKVSNFLDQI